MKTKAVFLDWYNTLAHHDPPSELLHGAACRSYGIEADPSLLRAGIAVADRYFYEENVRSRVDKRLPNEQVELYTRYEDIVLKTAGVAIPQGMGLPIWMKVREMARGSTFVLFEDVPVALEQLRKRSFIIVLISNLPQDMKPMLKQLGLLGLIDQVVGPGDAGAEKPDPRIFQYALAKAQVDHSEAVHVGDQYHVDVVGARAAGIEPILIDRFDIHPEADCRRIKTLAELPAILL
ncbi:MAG: HAD family hydrolase [Dehalococcoidia bacterium]|nr:HAD family hydrolase [Dehalococcoidia bacterium]